MRTNGAKAWALASRPKTLTGAAAPVVVGLAAAYAMRGSLIATPSVLCLVFALLMQVVANLVNDYVDFLNGRDTDERLGPRRACAEGWITPRAMRWGIGLTLTVACLCGLPLVMWGGWGMVLIGTLCVVFCLLYSLSLAQRGMGDLLVLVFFGLVPVCATFYVQTAKLTPCVVWLSLAMGLATDVLLVVNNYRDIRQDSLTGKRTLAVRLGKGGTRRLHLWAGLLALCIALCCIGRGGGRWQMVFMLPYLITHMECHRLLVRIDEGAELNRVQGMTGLAIALFALGLALALALTP